MEPGYELFDHTADIGIRVRAASLPELIAPALQGLYAVIGELVSSGSSEPITWDLTGAEPAVLLRDCLGEALVLFELERRVLGDVQVSEFSDERLRIEAGTYAVDGERSVYHREAKAVTYHGLEIAGIPGGYQATIIVDI